MHISDLIQNAKKNSGMNLGEIAKEMQISQSKFTAWSKGEYKPSSGEIASLADKAGLPIFETVLEMDIELHPQYAHVWEKAILQLRQNQGLSRSLLMIVTRKKGLKGPFC